MDRPPPCPHPENRRIAIAGESGVFRCLECGGVARKKPYVPPEIKPLGSVRDRTRTGGTSPVLDNLNLPNKVSGT